jgi:hypothetical protein
MITLYICAEDSFLDKQGIHLKHPDTWYLEHSIEDAEKDMFDAIYLHYPTSGRQLQVSPCVLQMLFELAARRKRFRVEVIDPAHNETSYANYLAIRGAK